MSNPVAALRRLLVKGPPTTAGTVVSVAGNVLKVTTNLGVVQVANATATTYKEGDTVRVKGDVVLGKVTNRQDLPVYHV